jgi:uncharacterized protein (TIGR03067 family)
MSDTFCILPWKSLSFSAYGNAAVCCQFKQPLTTEEGLPISVYNHSLDEIWNSQDLRSIRQSLLAGESITACEQCYHHEAAGEISLRQMANADWQRGLPDEQLTTLDSLRAWSNGLDYRVPAPSRLELTLSNLCNLKCRMCNASFSSRIDRDPVHRKWSGSHLPLASEGERWWEQDVHIKEILRHPEQLVELSLLGGEPLLIKECAAILQHLVDAGAASHIDLIVLTNGTTTASPWLKLTEQFRQLLLCFSIDGAGATYDYIRYPGRWTTLQKNIKFFGRMANATLSAHVTVQAYNALGLVDLFRSLDRLGLPFNAKVLVHPARLATKVLPPRARKVAAERLRAYAENDCKPAQRELVLGLASGLESLKDTWDMNLFHEFMLFTNDLDRSRDQSLPEALPELWDVIKETGFAWKDAREHSETRRESDEMAKFQGTWKVLRAEDAGQRLPLLEGMALAFNGDEITVQRQGLQGRKVIYYKLEETEEPKSLALFLNDRIIRVDYQLEANQVMKWHRSSSPDQGRAPMESQPGSAFTLIVLQRQTA